MKRREFLKYGSAGLTLPFWLQYCDFPGTSYPVSLHSDHHTGHLLFQSTNWKAVRIDAIEVAIVGGGLAGLAAAHQLGETNFQVFELSDSFGGTVSTASFDGVQFSQGAHYDLAYPDHYGEEVISLLDALNLIKYEPWKRAWSFKDQQHLIPSFRKQQCYDFGNRRKDVIPESLLKNQFVDLMLQYDGEMRMPTRLINTQYATLNDISFSDFLRSELPITSDFLQQVNYHMYDDYGGDASMVSALAGIHYFTCRPYYTQDVPLFSPPNGNRYFADAMINKMNPGRLRSSCLVKSIRKDGEGFELEIVNIRKQVVEEVRARSVIYAGQKHALKYVYPEQASLFETTYAPWMVVNLITQQKTGVYGHWQNEFLGKNPSFLGFIDSSVQSQASLNGKRVFTGYYCLSPSDRQYLIAVADSKESIARETQGYVEEMLETSIDVEGCCIKVMGHAMPIPAPGYLLKDANNASNAEMIYAGVDNGKLPLLYEALDSGLQAASLI